MSEEKKKRKLEERRIKEVNTSLKYLSSSVQKKLGILAVQEQDNVFFCEDKRYKKVYTVRPAILQNKKYELIKALCDTFHNRIRFTQALKNSGDKIGSYMFMTVNFEAGTYYEAKKEIEEFENKIQIEITSILHIDIQPCTLDNLLSYMVLNYSGKMQQFDIGRLFSSKETLNFGDNCKDAGNGKFILSGNNDNCGIVCVGKGYPHDMPEMTTLFEKEQATYLVCIDFQSYDADDKEIYRLALNSRYSNERTELDQQNVINMSYFLAVIKNDSEQLENMTDRIFDYYDKEQVLLMPGVGRTQEIFLSMSSLGMKDFHSMQNTNPRIISNLFM